MSVAPARQSDVSHARTPSEPEATAPSPSARERSRRERAAHVLRQQMDMVGTVLGIVITAVVGFVGLTAMQTTKNSTSLSGTDFASSSTALTDGVNSAFSLIEVAFIVAILGLVIAALVGLRSRR
jgi:ABC-type phosphate transport system permease subunit